MEPVELTGLEVQDSSPFVPCSWGPFLAIRARAALNAPPQAYAALSRIVRIVGWGFLQRTLSQILQLIQRTLASPSP